MSSSGRKKAHIPGNLAKYMFFKRCAELKADRTVEFFKIAGSLYNPSPNLAPKGEGDEISDGEDDLEFLDD
uniref:Uncharacterized protein n=1 Tax=Acrobeloides nanus TaxID=290746 RepID=A0A914D8A4_9BILA